MLDICQYCNKKSPATQKLCDEDLRKLGDSCCQITFQKGERIMFQDAVSYDIVFIIDGLVKVHAAGPEKEQILKIVKGPSYIGIPAKFGARINQYSATCITKINACLIGFEVFKDFIMGNGEFAYEIILELCRNELYYYKKYINQLQKQGPGKIAEALLYFSDTIFNATTFELPLSRDELGNFTCTSRETVSRIFSDFSKNKIIEINKKDISIIDKRKLELISEKG
ncbi:MAG: Crp/Fnr family transcriptional regulator [Flavobacteriaceae bacterium]|nr:Crp/Fnr family transcriptional regulator [Flavobacteriaceae bacterium]